MARAQAVFSRMCLDLFVQCILFSNKVIVFPTQKESTVMCDCSAVGLAAGQRLLHDTWSWSTISSPSPLPACFPGW